ncbi:MAG: phosphoenolpyruvate--protein phosphotransferase [Defluviitaleaceae bacterium]|nr:phosphoenolpyruvate--protein phosphotransferase [Defluviitaleaceae bacterium]
MEILLGICGSPGYASGTAVIKSDDNFELSPYKTREHDKEIAKFRAAQDSYDKELTSLIASSEKELGAESAEIFEAYKVILHDEAFFKKSIDRLTTESISLAYLIDDECRKVCAMFAGMDDPYLRERAEDIENVCTKLCRKMMGCESDFASEIASVGDAVVVAENLTPEETVKMDKSRLRAFVVEKGGATSHAAILAKALGIPAVMGVAEATARIKKNNMLLVCAHEATVTVNPDKAQLAAFEVLREKQNNRRRIYEESITLSADTLDGFHVDVNLNVGDMDSIKNFSSATCDGVGLFRTEFLYMSHRDYPDEETQFAAYKNIAQKAEGKEVIIRTLDIGGDKYLEYMNLPDEDNPFLGYRAIRICLDRADVFQTQLRAILRASAFGNVKIMFPMIVNLEELRAAKECVENAKLSLKNEGIPYREDIPVGIMVETPAAVLLSDILAAECDFFSVGSNDLIQYTTASDRMNDKVQHLYDNCNISVLRAIQITARNAAKHSIPWGICGEVASDARLVPLWVAMGVSELSVSSAAQVGHVKYIIRNLNREEVTPVTDLILSGGLINNVKAQLDKILQDLDK